MWFNWKKWCSPRNETPRYRNRRPMSRKCCISPWMNIHAVSSRENFVVNIPHEIVRRLAEQEIVHFRIAFIGFYENLRLIHRRSRSNLFFLMERFFIV